MAKVLKFKAKKEPIDPLTLKSNCVINELKHQLRSAQSDAEVKTILLTVFAEVSMFIFSTHSFQDPRVALSNGLSTLFERWCKSKKNKEKE